MVVQELKNEGLMREFKVTLPAAALQQQMEKRLAELSKTVRMDGFRPGKVPMAVVRQRYASSVQGEVLEKAVNDNTEKLLAERGLRPALQPQIKLVSEKFDADVEYNLTCEILPAITPMDFRTISLQRMMAAPPAADVEKSILMSAKRLRGPEFVTEARAAKNGDVLVINYAGSADGKEYPGMSANNQRLELGSNMFIPGFEEQLVGAKKGDEKVVKVTFPTEYHSAELAGKAAEFKVTVLDLMTYAPITIDDALAKEMGFEDLAKLQAAVSEQMGQEYNSMTRTLLKRDLFDQLMTKHDFMLPPSLVEREFNTIWQRLQFEKERGMLDESERNKSEADLEKDYRKIAERRVRLGLLLAEVGSQQNIKVAEAELRRALIAEVQKYPGQEKAVFEFYTQTPGALERIQAPLFEDKVVDYILALAKISDQNVTAEELREKAQKAEA